MKTWKNTHLPFVCRQKSCESQREVRLVYRQDVYKRKQKFCRHDLLKFHHFSLSSVKTSRRKNMFFMCELFFVVMENKISHKIFWFIFFSWRKCEHGSSEIKNVTDLSELPFHSASAKLTSVKSNYLWSPCRFEVETPKSDVLISP